MSVTQPILICGAGISGLALAQGLFKARIAFRLFERDPALNIRAQGYRVRIIQDGLDALTSILTPELYALLQASCAIIAGGGSRGAGHGSHINALTGEDQESPMGNPPRSNVTPLSADRMVLRSVLSKGLEEYVEFGKEFSAYEITPTGVTVRFRDGSEVQGALLVGADGASSHIRKQLIPDHVNVDTEGRWIYGKTTLTPELEERLDKRTLQGITLIQDRSSEVPMSLLLETLRFKDNEYRKDLPADYIYWVLGSRKDRYDMDDAELLNLSAEEAAALSRKMTSDWQPSLQVLFEHQDTPQTAMIRIISSRPEISTWKPTGRVTLIGDACHVMSPTAGVGATTALRDSGLLTQVIKDEGVTVESIGRYERLMREYASEAILKSLRGGKVLMAMRDFDQLKPVVSQW